MSFDSRPPEADGQAGLVEWCRRDRETPRTVLAAAAGDPVALADLASQLVWPGNCVDPTPNVEILAVRRIEELVQLASQWPDITEQPDESWLLAVWECSLRHLAQQGAINVAAVLHGPLLKEAQIVVDEARPDDGPIAWQSVCRKATRRDICLDELRAIASLGLVEPSLDVGSLKARRRSLLRVLRGRWDDAVNLESLINPADMALIDDPIDLAVFWEVAVATGKADTYAHEVGEHLTTRLLSDDEPADWWPAVLAVLTGWVVP